MMQWRPDGTGVDSNGDCGGDIQHGDSYSVRFIGYPDLAGGWELVVPPRHTSMITETYYAVEYNECPGEFVVQRQVEFMVCEDPADPGGTEIWSEVTYDDVSYLVIDTAAEAEQEARSFAGAALGHGDIHGWDGLPDYNH